MNAAAPWDLLLVGGRLATLAGAEGYGMVEDWNVSGEDSRLQLSKWSFSKDSAP